MASNYTLNNSVYLIDGIDLSSYGGWVETSEGFFTIPARKKILENNWVDQNGVEADLSIFEVEARTLKLTLGFVATSLSDLQSVLKTFLNAFAKPGTIYLKMAGNPYVYIVYLKDAATPEFLSKLDDPQQVAKLSLQLVEPNPINRQYFTETGGAVSLDITTTEPVTIDWGDHTYGTLTASGTVSKTLPSGVYAITVYSGSISSIVTDLTPVDDLIFVPDPVTPVVPAPVTIGPQGAQGSQGAQGAQGRQGFQGAIGPQGGQGLQGIQGSIGYSGLQGEQGSKGDQGYQGSTGAGSQGPQGNQGSTGDNGPNGNQGYQGNQGNQGTIGFQGNQGSEGNQGFQGNNGSNGSQGSQGTNGLNGSQGNQGNQGINGSNGSQGNQGNQGNQGSQGTNGSNGSQGNQGNQGINGSNGSQGNQGNQGSQGSQGTNGSNGSQGNQGNQGINGSNGSQGNQGDQGEQGLQGDKGNEGPQGNGMSLEDLNSALDKKVDIVPGTGLGMGYLYNWYAVDDSRHIANLGWHVATNSDKESLKAFTDENSAKLRMTGTDFWQSPNTGATDEFRFNDKGSGMRNYDSLFYQLFQSSYHWISDSEAPYGPAWDFEFYNNSSSFYWGGLKDPKMGLSVRLVKDFTRLSHGETGIYIGNDGKIYRTICIGSEEWLRENLIETKYRDGSIIPKIQAGYEWANLTTGAMCAYQNNEFNALTGDYRLISPDEVDLLYNSIGSQGPQGYQGDNGTQGSQGNQGYQGDNGTQGPQGNQGNQGNQGAQGANGSNGSQGNQGAQGANGSNGSQGNQGDQGKIFSIPYTFNSSTALSDPGSGKCAFNNVAVGFATSFQVSKYDSLGRVNNMWARMNGGVFQIGDVVCNVYAITDLTTYWRLTVGPSNTTTPTNGVTYDIFTNIPGPQGYQGNQGNQGNQGAASTVQGQQGNQGNQGNNGPNGSQGNQGNQGNQGSQGEQGNQGLTGSGAQGNQGNQGNDGAQSNYGVQGNQVTCTAQTVTNIFNALSVSPSSTYQYEAQFGCQPAAGTQGLQIGIQCSVAGATVEGIVLGPASTSADKSFRQIAQGNGTLPVQNVAGAQSVRLSGIIVTPAGSPAIGVQVKGVQASQAWYIKPNGFIKLTKIS